MAGNVQGRIGNEDYYGPDSGGRQKNVTVVKPIVIGCRSKFLPEPIPNPHPQHPSATSSSTPATPTQMHTHRWTLYLRPYHNEDLSLWIKKVQFKLHDTYPNCLRTCSSLPFEVEETGWGEFEVQIKIFYIDPNERQVTLWTFVKLFKKDPTDINSFFNKEGYLINEYYDELVFVEPSQMMLDMLNAKRHLPSFQKSEVDYDKKRVDTIQSIRKARDRVTPEIQAMSAQFEAFKSAFSGILAVVRGEQPQAAGCQSNVGSEYGGSVCGSVATKTSSQVSRDQSTAD